MSCFVRESESSADLKRLHMRVYANPKGSETASADHIPGVLALIEGLSQKKPAGHFIHVGGTGMLNDVPMALVRSSVTL